MKPKALIIMALLAVFLSFASGVAKVAVTLQEDHSREKHEIASTSQKTNYSFSIGFKETSSDFPEEIIVRFENRGDGLMLHNFMLQFLSDEDSYWGLNDDFRFVDRQLVLIENSIVSDTLRLDSFSYKSMKTNEFVSFEDFKESLLSGSGFKVLGIIGDRSKAQNPFESNLTTRSNMIEYRVE
jgi:hypothetical protein